MTLSDMVKMMMDLKADWFLDMVGFDAKCTRQATYEVILPAYVKIFTSPYVRVRVT